MCTAYKGTSVPLWPSLACSPLFTLTPPLAALQTPGLAVVLVGERKDSQTYVRSKKKACEEVGIKSFGVDLPDTATEDEVLKVRWEASSCTVTFASNDQSVDHSYKDLYASLFFLQVVADFNADPAVHGILVQLPLPKHIDETRVLDAISLEKDVDGKLLQGGGDLVSDSCALDSHLSLWQKKFVKWSSISSLLSIHTQGSTPTTSGNWQCAVASPCTSLALPRAVLSC